jgi:hypothetical protein
MQKLTFFLAVALLLSGCASMQQNKWLASHQTNLKRFADSNLSAEQKIDGLIQDYVLFMKEDLKFVDPAKGIKYVQKYHDQNEASMNKILKDAENWQGKLNLSDKVNLGLRVVQKPYLKDLIDLAPKFKRKYKEYAFAVKLASKVSGGLGKLAGKELGF